MTETAQFRVLDFDCPTCATTVERALRKTDGVQRVEVHYATGRVEVDYADGTTPDELAATIENQGYTPRTA